MTSLHEHLAPEPERGDISDDLNLLIAVAEWGEDTDAILKRAVSVQDKLALFTAVKAAKGACEGVRKALEAEIGESLGKGTTSVPEVGHVVVSGKPNRTEWDHERLLSDVIRLVRDEPATRFDPDTGEERPIDTVPEVVIRRLRSIASFKWLANKKEQTGLWSLGLDPDEYAKTDWTVTVQQVSTEGAA